MPVPCLPGSWSESGGSTPRREGRRQCNYGAQSISIGHLARSSCRSPLVCKNGRGDSQLIVSETSGRKKLPEYVTRNRTNTPSSRRPGPMCGDHAVHDKNKIGDYFMNRPPRSHEFKVEKRMISQSHQTHIVGSKPSVSQFVVTPDAERRHYGSGIQTTLLKSDPSGSANENSRIRLLKAGASRRMFSPQASGRSSSPATPQRKRIVGDAASHGVRAAMLISGAHAAPRREGCASKIGSTAWLR